MIILPVELYDQMLAQARAELPLECCGLLAGTKTEGMIKLTAVYPATNIDQSQEHFSIDPREQLAALKDMRQKGWEMLGNYHSHPATPARPSAEDIKLAYHPDAVYMILSLMQPDAPVLKAFRVAGGEAAEVKLVLETGMKEGTLRC